MLPLWKQSKTLMSWILRLYDWAVRLIKYIGSALKDWRNWLIFAAVYAVMTSPTWVGWLLYFITGNPWHMTYSSAYMAFRALPLTPLIPLCIAITLGIRRLFRRFFHRK